MRYCQFCSLSKKEHPEIRRTPSRTFVNRELQVTMAIINGVSRGVPDYGSLQNSPSYERNGHKILRVQENEALKQGNSQNRPHTCSWLRILGCLFVVACVGIAALRAQNVTHITNSDNNDNLEFEYIVVGGGPAGILTATKLSRYLMSEEHASKKQPSYVLLLESGTETQSAVYSNLDTSTKETEALWETDDVRLNKYDIPLLWSGIASRPPIDKGNLPPSSHHWPIKHTLLARVLGGCGLHNAMLYVRALPNDFARWNLTGWTWETLLPHYIHLEKYVDNLWPRPSFWNKDEDSMKKSCRGHDGPIVTVPAGPKVDAVSPLFIESAVHSGISRAGPGFNDPSKRVGAGFYEFNIHNGVRDSVAQAMLGTSNGIPPNLIVQTGATVTSVLTERTHNETTRAVGVEYLTDNDDVRSEAMLKRNTGEVILAAGAIMTPQLLTNSGISDGGRVAHVPGVGKNLQDHPVIAMAYLLDSELVEEAPSMFTLASDFADYFQSVKHLQEAENDGNASPNTHTAQEWATLLGALGTAGFSSGAFLKSPWAQFDSPDIQLTVFPRIVEPHVLHRQKNTTNDPLLLKSKAMLVTVALLHPEGRYEVKASKAGTSLFRHNDFDFPLPSIELHTNETCYLTDHDVKRMSWGVQQVRRILSFPPLYNMTGGELYPGSDYVDTGDLHDYIRSNHLTNSHWVGSTKMGDLKDDPLAVVDDRLRVRGVGKLRIVDAGVIPHVPNGNTHSTVCVVASRAVELMIAERNESKIR